MRIKTSVPVCFGLLAAVLGVWWLLASRDSRTTDDAPSGTPAASRRSDAVHVPPSGERAPVPQITADPDAIAVSDAQVSDDDVYQTAFMVFDELAESIESLSPDCVAMAEAMELVIDERIPALNAALATLDGGAEGLAASPHGMSATRRVAQLHAVLKAQMPTCSAQLLPVLKRWSEVAAATLHPNTVKSVP